MTRTVPVIDLAPFIDGSDKATVVRQIDEACRGLGFLVIKGHGVPADVIQQTLGTAKGLFAKDPAEKKGFNAGQAHGYQKFANMSLAQSFSDEEFPPDLREGLTLRPADFGEGSPVWPETDEKAGFQDVFGRYYAELNRLSSVLLEIFEIALGTESGKLRASSDNHTSNLSIYHYPPMERAPLPGQMRGGEHTDFGSMTILMGFPSVHGLQIKNGEEWEPAPIEEGSFVVNIGDLMERWTNGIYKSTFHRVANPVDGDWSASRYSIVFFHQPNEDAIIESLDKVGEAQYPPITSGEHFLRKSGAMFTGIK